ncbi:uncharacterized protein [Solanum lycopersicum]|uniref:uncharacterized protein n=1 Tax=Solanum lycopersicum TaxID=4081 RepID=UPI0037481848
MVYGLQDRILQEAPSSINSNHPGSTKINRDFKEVYWWEGMKINISQFVAKCSNCQQVKVEHQRPGGLAVRLDGVLVSIISYRGAQFIAQLWKSFKRVSMENVDIQDNLRNEEVPFYILDRQVCKLRIKEVDSVKFFWSNQFIEEATWEAEEDMKNTYPYLFE